MKHGIKNGPRKYLMAKRFLHVVALLVSTLLAVGASNAAPAERERERDARRSAERLAPGIAQDARNGGSNRQNQAFQSRDAQENASRPANRMSPEDRRNLRRQINEAGQDIYVPRR